MRPSLANQRGQATTEYLVVVIGVLLGLGIIGLVGGKPLADDVAGALQSSLDDVSFLLNLPF